MNSVLRSSKDINALRGLHWAAKAVYRGQGYRWELRRNGEVKLGYWRKSFRKRNQRNPYPKRFVLMPGFGDTPLSWHAVVVLLHPILKQNFDEVILFDFPGFGGFLSKERAFPSIDMMMTSVADALDSLKPHTIFGHSLGGWLAGHYAGLCGGGKRPAANRLNYSGPSTLIVANPSGIYPDEQTMRQCEAIIKGSLGIVPDDGVQPDERFTILRPHLFAREPNWFKLIVPHFKQFLAREDISQFIQSARQDLHTLDGIAKEIQAKTWVLWGEKDTLVPVTCADAWMNCLEAQEKGRRSAVILKDAGHSPHIETPLATAVVMGQILSGKVPHKMGKRWWSVVA